MKDIRRRGNQMVDFSKFTFNKKILSKVVTLCYNQFCQGCNRFGLASFLSVGQPKPKFSICKILNRTDRNNWKLVGFGSISVLVGFQFWCLGFGLVGPLVFFFFQIVFQNSNINKKITTQHHNHKFTLHSMSTTINKYTNNK